MVRDSFKPQAIIGLMRGGIVPSRIFSDYFDIFLDFFSLDVKLYYDINKSHEKPLIGAFHGDVKGKKILIVDDIWDSGRTMEAVLDYLKEEDVTTTTLFWKETAEGKPDYYAEGSKELEWVVFPWEEHEFRRLTSEQKVPKKEVI